MNFISLCKLFQLSEAETSSFPPPLSITDMCPVKIIFLVLKTACYNFQYLNVTSLISDLVQPTHLKPKPSYLVTRRCKKSSKIQLRTWNQQNVLIIIIIWYMVSIKFNHNKICHSQDHNSRSTDYTHIITPTACFTQLQQMPVTIK